MALTRAVFTLNTFGFALSTKMFFTACFCGKLFGEF
jgi:hypothetical protein